MEMTKYKLGDLCRIASSKRIFESEYVEKGVPFIRGQEISDGSILDPKASFECYISQSRYEEIKEKYGKPTKGDILITAVGTIGNLCYLDKDIDFYFKDGNVIWFSEIISSCEGKFLFHFMKSSFFKDQLKYFMIGAVQKALTIDMLKKVEVPLPPLSEQKKIASVLSALDDKIALNKKMNQKLEAMAKRLYDYWFVQYDFPDKNGHPYKTTGGPMTYNPTLKREIPVGWEVKKLEDCINLFDSKRVPLSSQQRASKKGMIPYYGATGIMDYIDDFIYDGEYILLAEDGSVETDEGFVIIQRIWGKTWVNNHAHVIQPKEKGQYEFYFQVLSSIVAKKITTGSIQKKISQENMNAYKLLAPPKDLILKYCLFVHNSWEKQKKIADENIKLQNLRDNLLPLLMNGQVTVA
jgi:type I restriction enzyme S subunit